MTREAKIGMLTGLGVIVLIGVLLSNYLGADGRAGGGMSPTGRMAELPMGAAYRQEVTEPVGVPGVARQESGVSAPVAAVVIPAGVPAAGKGSMDSSGAPAMAAGPVVGEPVMPVPAGMVQAVTASEGNVPTLQLAEAGVGQEAMYVTGQGQARGKSGLGYAATMTPGEMASGKPDVQYVIQPGDNLAKIARKFYGSAKSSNIDLIIASNPKMLKDTSSTLVAGKALAIYLIPKGSASDLAAIKPVGSAQKSTQGKGSAAVVIHQPGGATVAAGTDEAKTIDAPVKKKTTAVYVVVSGDTLEKIAKKLAPGHVVEMEKKLASVNGIKDPTGLKVGQKLKVPGVG